MRVRGGASRTLSSAANTRAVIPHNVDLLQTYKGLVALGKIKSDDEQIRVVMQVNLQTHLRELTLI